MVPNPAGKPIVEIPDDEDASQASTQADNRILVRNQLSVAKIAQDQVLIAVGENELFSLPDLSELPLSPLALATADDNCVRKIVRLKLLQRITEVLRVVEEMH